MICYSIIILVIVVHGEMVFLYLRTSKATGVCFLYGNRLLQGVKKSQL